MQQESKPVYVPVFLIRFAVGLMSLAWLLGLSFAFYWGLAELGKNDVFGAVIAGGAVWAAILVGSRVLKRIDQYFGWKSDD